MAIDTEDEFTDVYRAHYDDVLRFVRRRAHPMNVDDIVGETFLAAWRRRSELPEDRVRGSSAPHATRCSTPSAGSDDRQLSRCASWNTVATTAMTA